jgi:hypothetical protein
MHGISAAGRANAGMKMQFVAKQTASEGSPAEEAKESDAQKTMEATKNTTATTRNVSPSPQGTGTGVNLLA